MPNRHDFINISKRRLEEAKLLQSKKFYDGAYYIAGYVIEAALKARVCKILGTEFPESGQIGRAFKTHNFEELILLAGLQQSLEHFIKDANFKTNWSLITGWKETHRYNLIGDTTAEQVDEFFNAMENKDHGILTWIKKRW